MLWSWHVCEDGNGASMPQYLINHWWVENSDPLYNWIRIQVYYYTQNPLKFFEFDIDTASL